MKRLQGRAALVTGAGRGIGLAIARAFAAEGAAVGIVDVDADSAAAAHAEIEALGVKSHHVVADLSDRRQAAGAVDAIAQTLGRLDTLVNNAMWIRYQPIEAIDEVSVEKMLGVGLKAVVWCTQAAIPHLAQAGGGTIINLASPAAEIGMPGAMIYCGIKGGVASMTRAASAELGSRNIRVTAIAPGPIVTPGAGAVVDQAGFEKRLKRTPLGRFGTAEDIAKAAVFLASDDASFVSGTFLHVDGGLTHAFL